MSFDSLFTRTFAIFNSSCDIKLTFEHGYSQFQLTFHRKIPKFVRNFRSTFLIWEVGRELRNELRNELPNEFHKYDLQLQNKRVHS